MMKTLVLLALLPYTVSGFHILRTSRNVQTTNPDNSPNAVGKIPYGQSDDTYLVNTDDYDPSYPGYYALPDGGYPYYHTPDDGYIYHAEQVSGSRQDSNNVHHGLNGYPTDEGGLVDYGPTDDGGLVDYGPTDDGGLVDYVPTGDGGLVDYGPTDDGGLVDYVPTNDGGLVDYWPTDDGGLVDYGPTDDGGLLDYGPTDDGGSVDYWPTDDGGLVDYMLTDHGYVYQTNQDDGYVDYPTPEVGCFEQATPNDDFAVDYSSQNDKSQGYLTPEGASVYQSTYVDYPSPDVGCAYHFSPSDDYVDPPVPDSGSQVHSVDQSTPGSAHDNSTTVDGVTDQVKSSESTGNKTKQEYRPESKNDTQNDIKAIQTTTVSSSFNVTSKINTTVG